MKKSYSLYVLVSLLMLSSLVSSSRLLSAEEQDEKDDEITRFSTSDFSAVMGMEGCEEKDEECVKRRVVAEAHLDYIYTQNHSKP